MRPFPWASLDATTHGELEALRGLRRWLAQRVRLESVADSLASVVGAEVEVMIRRASRAAELRSPYDGIGVVLAPGDSPGMQNGFLVEFEHALAASVVARCLKRKAPVVLEPAAVGSSAIAGALGAILAAVARRAHADVPLHVVAAGPARALEADMARADPALAEATATVLVANQAFVARLIVPARALNLTSQPGCDAAELTAALGPVALTLPIVACATRATVADVASLRPGDVWLPGAWPLHLEADRQLVGPVLLAAPAAGIGFRADLGVGGRLVLRGEPQALCAAEANMGEPVPKSELIEAVGEVPVVVRVEIGEARMQAREWAALRRGDVVALGRRVGEAVVLRVGGLALARGDLVEIEGEVGVRIVERVAEGKSSP